MRRAAPSQAASAPTFLARTRPRPSCMPWITGMGTSLHGVGGVRRGKQGLDRSFPKAQEGPEGAGISTCHNELGKICMGGTEAGSQARAAAGWQAPHAGSVATPAGPRRSRGSAQQPPRHAHDPALTDYRDPTPVTPPSLAGKPEGAGRPQRQHACAHKDARRHDLPDARRRGDWSGQSGKVQEWGRSWQKLPAGEHAQVGSDGGPRGRESWQQTRTSCFLATESIRPPL